MSEISKKRVPDATGNESAEESLKRMIYFTKRQAEKDGKTFCAYFLDMALSALEEDSDEMNELVKARVTPLPLPTAEHRDSA